MIKRHSSAVMALALAVYTSGCHAESGSVDWLSPGDSTAVVTLKSDDMICMDCVEMKRVTALGDTTGDGFVVFSRAMVQDRLGRYWLNQEDRIKVFDSNGAYVREVGQPGKGPMEFSNPLPLRANADGNVVIFDPGNGRESIISPEFELASETRFRSYVNFNDAVPMPVAHLYAASIWMANTDRELQAVHVISADSILASFGADPSLSGPEAPMKAMRVLATDESGRIFSAKVYDYSIGVWTSSGRKVVRFSGPRLNEHEPKWAWNNFGDNPLSSRILDMQSDPEGRLWVLTLQVKPDWRDLFEEKKLSDGAIHIVPKKGVDPAFAYTGRVDVIDPHRARIVAQINAPAPLGGFVTPGLMYQFVTLPDGNPQIAIWKVDLDSLDRS